MLAERNIPHQEIIASPKLFEQAAQTVFPNDLPGPLRRLPSACRYAASPLISRKA
jgi:hypothetical protein